MQTRAFGLFATFVFVSILVCLAAFRLSLDGSAVPTIAIIGIIAAVLLLLLSPRYALMLIALSRFSFELAWQTRIAGLGVLDFLGVAIPCGVLVLVMMLRPRLSDVPLIRPILAWVALVWGLGLMSIVAGSDTVPVIESSVKFTSGGALFVLAAIVVTRFRHALTLTVCWVLGAIPVALVLLALGGVNQLEYHGVQRLRAIYHDPGTPAIVASLGLIGAIFLIRIGRQLAWRMRYLLLLGALALVLSRVLFLTFSGALTAGTALTLLTMAVIEKRWMMFVCCIVLLAGFWQIPAVQKRWHREASIVQGTEEAVAFASGRPNRWRRLLIKYDQAPTVDKLIGVHGRWGNPENGFLHLLFDLGPIGGMATLALLAWIARSLWTWWRDEDDPAIKLFYLMTVSIAIGYSASWVTATPLIWMNMQWFLWGSIGACAALRTRERSQDTPALA